MMSTPTNFFLSFIHLLGYIDQSDSIAAAHAYIGIGGGSTGATGAVAPVLWQLRGQCPRTKYKFHHKKNK